ncbi:MAG TPA: flippase activity-associated protein Agl23 [Candidatus Limnocylindrales bacterium]
MAALAILLVAAALRLPMLALNPFHNDEGVNGFFTTNLLRDGVYTYDPANYHGPSLYYFALVSATLFGLTTEAMRLVPVLCGLVTIALVLPLRRFLGPVAVLAAAALLAVSPGAVYVSRYFIHESLLVCFTLALVVSCLLYLDTRRPGYVIAAAASAALMFTTKETGIIAVVVLLIAAVATRFYVRFRGGATADRSRRGAAAPGASVYVRGVEYRRVDHGHRTIEWEPLAGAAIVFLAIYVLLYSSFFTNFPKGLVDSVATFMVWTQTGAATQVQPIQEYLVWMARADAPILVLGAIGGVLAAVSGRDRTAVFIGLWALGITAAYSLIQYKTPWIALNMLVPLALLGGIALRELSRSARWRRVAPMALAAGVLISGFQAVDLNYRHYDDETYPYVYVHTTRQTLALVDRIDQVAAKAGTGRNTGVAFVTDEYWPLPWYMRDYPQAIFYGQIADTDAPMIVANVTQEPDLGRFSSRYTRAGTYTLRPGVDLALYIRNDLAGA